MSVPEDRMTQSLVAGGIITDQQLERAKHMQADMGGTVTEALMRLRFVTAQDLAQAVEAAQEDEGKKQSLANYRIDPEALRDIPRSVAEQHLVLPIAMSEDRIVVAMADATNVFAMDEVRTRTNRRVEPIEVDEAELLAAIDQFYSVRARADLPTSGAVVDMSQPVAESGLIADASDEVVQLVDQRPVIHIVDTLIKRAVQARASDIHIEPREQNVAIRYRIDGLLHVVSELPKEMQEPVAARIKILANMDIAEKRLPQDGRFQASADDKIIDLRVSSRPTFYGEKVVLRIMDPDILFQELDGLGFSATDLICYNRFITMPLTITPIEPVIVPALA